MVLNFNSNSSQDTYHYFNLDEATGDGSITIGVKGGDFDYSNEYY